MIVSCGSTTSVEAQDAADMARLMQDPLASIKALMTDNDINFNSGNDQTSYGFQLQPVYAVPFDEAGFNFIMRGVFPIVGMAPEAQKPILGQPLPPDPDGELQWGFSDAVLQFFFSPKTESAWKWGVGPTVSLPIRSNDALAGPGWGAGPIAVLVGNLTPDISSAFIAGHLWGDENSFSTSILQPMVFYNIPGSDGWTLHYSNIISYDWSAASGNEWTVPLGLGTTKMLSLGGVGVEPLVGYYYNVARPDGAADHVLKWAVSFLFSG
jgi:hypothetical protein